MQSVGGKGNDTLEEAEIDRPEAERAVILGVIDSQIGVHDLLPASHDFLDLLGLHQGLARPCNDPVEPLGTFRGPRGLYGPGIGGGEPRVRKTQTP